MNPCTRARLALPVNSGGTIFEPGKRLTFVVPRVARPDGKTPRRIKLERLMVSPPINHLTHRTSGTWHIRNLWIDDIPQLEHGEPGERFMNKTFPPTNHVNWFPILEPHSQIALDVENQSDAPAAFYGGILGFEVGDETQSSEICGPIRVRDTETGEWISGTVTGPARVKPNEVAEFTFRAHDRACAAFRVDRIDVERRPEWWSIGGVFVHDQPQFLHEGEIPADMFSSSAIGSFVSFEAVQTAMTLKMKVRYLGHEERGERFYGATLYSIVAR